MPAGIIQYNSSFKQINKLGNYEKISEILGFDGKYSADYPKDKF